MVYTCLLGTSRKLWRLPSQKVGEEEYTRSACKSDFSSSERIGVRRHNSHLPSAIQCTASARDLDLLTSSAHKYVDDLPPSPTSFGVFVGDTRQRVASSQSL